MNSLPPQFSKNSILLHGITSFSVSFVLTDLYGPSFKVKNNWLNPVLGKVVWIILI